MSGVYFNSNFCDLSRYSVIKSFTVFQIISPSAVNVEKTIINFYFVTRSHKLNFIQYRYIQTVYSFISKYKYLTFFSSIDKFNIITSEL